MQTPSRSADSTASTGGLDLRIAARNSTAVLTLHNGGPDPLKVLSHVDANDRHYDWFTILLERLGERRSLHLYDNRNESHLVIADLNPGQDLEHVIDVAAWSAREVNGSQPLTAGTYRMWATYEVSEPGPVWNGKLVSPTVEITIP